MRVINYAISYEISKRDQVMKMTWSPYRNTFYNESLLKRIRDTQIKTYEKDKITRYESQPLNQPKI